MTALSAAEHRDYALILLSQVSDLSDDEFIGVSYDAPAMAALAAAQVHATLATLTGNAQRGGTRFRTRGGRPETADQTVDVQPLLSATYHAQDLLDAGWPILDLGADHSTVTTQATLDSHAARLRDTFAGTVRIPAITLDAAAGITPRSIGDRAQLRLTSPLHPARADGAPGYERSVRMIGLQVAPAQRGRPDQIVPVLNEEP